ncbi:MAG: hypothetical protein P9M13_03290 [Candidatus Ancaeobacter aquaticus]|nr:hypothetical protein [Candidatus Ancaeobacter aquaticus]
MRSFIITCFCCISLLSFCVYTVHAYQQDNHIDDAKEGVGENIGKSTDDFGAEIGKSAQKVGEGALQGTGEILNSVSDLLKGIGTQFKQKPDTNIPSSTPRNSSSTNGYTPSLQKKIHLSCSHCGQDFEVIGFPKGSNYYCPNCGKEVGPECTQ